MSEQTQRTMGYSGWTVRKDLAITNGFKQIWEIPNAGVDKFEAFMEDRERVE